MRKIMDDLMDSQNKLLVNSEGAAELLSISKRKFLAMVKTGEIGPAPIRFGSRVLFSVAALSSWVEQSCPNSENFQQGGRQHV